MEVSPAGDYQLLVRARDGEGNITPSKQVTLHAVDPFEPRDPSDVFGQASYLDDLLKFAGRRMVDAQGVSLTPARFTTAYRQHFTNLTEPNNREAATAPVRQVRVCVEVLRAFLAGIDKSAPPAEEAKYRQSAYAALLRNLGTSFDEIRRARGDEATRERLAARLGVDRPERLDELVLLPEQVTEAKTRAALRAAGHHPRSAGPASATAAAHLAVRPAAGPVAGARQRRSGLRRYPRPDHRP